MNAHVVALRELVVDCDFLISDESKRPFCIDERNRYFGEAWVVVLPHTVAAVQAIMRYCYQHYIPVTPQGGNTGLCGGATPTRSGIILGLGKLNRLRDINTVDYCITVEAGMVLAEVQRLAQSVDLFFPLSLASEATCQIGGNIACNAGGLNVVRYGTTRDLVLGLEVVLPDGSLVSHLQPLHKNTSGLDLKHQFIGSEGTLGVITAASLKLFAPQRSLLTAWVGVESIQVALRILESLKKQFSERLVSFELLSDEALTLSAQLCQVAKPVQAAWHILFELSDSLVDIDMLTPLADIMAHLQIDQVVLAQSEKERVILWQLREKVSAAQRQLGASIKHDIAVPIIHIEQFIHQCASNLYERFANIRIIVFGHLGDGSLHYNVFFPDILDNRVYELEDGVNQVVYQTVLALNGTIAAEHGIGQLKRQWLPVMRTPEEMAWMMANKQLLDPHGIMNPDKLLPESKQSLG